MFCKFLSVGVNHSQFTHCTNIRLVKEKVFPMRFCSEIKWVWGMSIEVHILKDALRLYGCVHMCVLAFSHPHAWISESLQWRLLV